MTVMFCQGIITFPATYDDECNSMKIWWESISPLSLFNVVLLKTLAQWPAQTRALCNSPQWDCTLWAVSLGEQMIGVGESRNLGGVWPCCRQVTPSSRKIGTEAFLQVTATLQGRLHLTSGALHGLWSESHLKDLRWTDVRVHLARVSCCQGWAC